MNTKKNLAAEPTISAGASMPPGAKYQPYLDWLKVELPNRTWPERQITEAPMWCSVDLRDGNQALINPMDVDRKIELFNLLLSLGFKEIEIGFPSASQVEYDFARTLIDSDLIPEDVIPQVLTQARAGLIDRTFEAIDGARQTIVHIYNSTSELQRRVVFQKPPNEIIDIAVKGVERVKQLASQTHTQIILEYSPESFTGTELEFALEVCEAVMDVWEPTPSRKLILNLPATVEMSTPNVYADQIEWFCTNIKSRDSVLVSLHTHNDRGTAVAATELGLLAGADRVEGTLFGNGERTGNVDLLTLALNLFSQGVDPRLDLRDIARIRSVAESCTRLPVHQRHPYAGDLVFTAFSGSHQDAIRKGMKTRIDNSSELWEVPYLPIDPLDIGSTYEAIVRINSQSGKGGAAYAVESKLGKELPKAMQPEFSAVVQELTENFGTEIPVSTLWAKFSEEYLDRTSPYKFVKFQHSSMHDGHDECTLRVVFDKEEKVFAGSGNGPIDACVHALLEGGAPTFRLADYAEHALTVGADAQAVAFIQIELDDGLKKFGVGIDTDTTTASIKAIISALNRSLGTIRPIQPDFVAHVMGLEFHCQLPQGLHAEFSAMLEPLSEASGTVVPPATIWSTFAREFLDRTSPYKFTSFHSSSKTNGEGNAECSLKTVFAGEEKVFSGSGNGPIDACVRALLEGGAPSFRLVDYTEHARAAGADTEAKAFIQIELEDGLRKFGVGIDTDTTRAAIKAIISALNRSFVTRDAASSDASGFLETEFHCNLPRKLRSQFNATARQSFRKSSNFIPLGHLWSAFQQEYLNRLDRPFRYVSFQSKQTENLQVGVSCELTVECEGVEKRFAGSGNGAIDACVHALLEGGCRPFRLADYHEHARSFGSDAEAAAYIEIEMAAGHRSFGVGIDRNTIKAAIKALLTAVNRALSQAPAAGDLLT